MGRQGPMLGRKGEYIGSEKRRFTRWPMKQIVKSVLLAAIFAGTLTVSIHAQTTIISYIHGNHWRSLPESSQMSYVAGFIDAWWLLDGVLQGSSEGSTQGFISRVHSQMQCMDTRNIPLGQMHEVVKKYMMDNPAEWDRPMSLLIQISLNQVCPPPR